MVLYRDKVLFSEIVVNTQLAVKQINSYSKVDKELFPNGPPSLTYENITLLLYLKYLFKSPLPIFLVVSSFFISLLTIPREVSSVYENFISFVVLISGIVLTFVIAKVRILSKSIQLDKFNPFMLRSETYFISLTLLIPLCFVLLDYPNSSFLIPIAFTSTLSFLYLLRRYFYAPF